MQANVVVLVDELHEWCLDLLRVAAQDPGVEKLPHDVGVDALDMSVELGGGAGRQDVLSDAELVAEDLEIAAELRSAVGLDALRDTIPANFGEQDRGVFRVVGGAQVRPDLPRDHIKGIHDVDHQVVEEGHLHGVRQDHVAGFLDRLRLLPHGVLALRLPPFLHLLLHRLVVSHALAFRDDERLDLVAAQEIADDVADGGLTDLPAPPWQVTLDLVPAQANCSLRSSVISAASSGVRFSCGLMLCGRVERFARLAGPPAPNSLIHSFSVDSPWPTTSAA